MTLSRLELVEVLLRVNFKSVLRRHFCDSKSPVTMKYLNVAEKNDAAKNIAGHLSRGTSRRREGFSQYNKIYEFEATVQNQKATMVMTSVSGHLLGFEFVGAYRHWQACNPLMLFDAPVTKHCPENYQKIKQTLEREIRGCQGLIIWTDCDREGENIGYEIIQVCTEKKTGLKILRAKFSEITAASVNRALQTLGQPNKNVSDAVDVRQELDLRIGAAFTRFQTLRLQKVFPTQLADSLISYGSCQFPTLGFVVERYRAIEKFIPESFWKIKVSHTMNNLTVDFNWERGRLFDEQACRVIHDVCIENPTATVLKVQSKPKSKWRPLPLDTIELEKNASRKLKINAKETMKIAEKLYTQGFISYPRTETNQYPANMDLGNLVQLQTPSREWGDFAQRILDSGGPTPRQGNKSDQAHPPIHPTKFTDGLNGNDKRVYEFIVRSFLACCSKDAQGQETTVQVDISQEKFNASGLMITETNYLDVYPYDKWSAKQLHLYQMGQQFQPTVLDLVDGQTSAPSLLTEADLISLMEKHGIGTDATHAEHIETIKSRSYVALTDNVHFVPGLLGMGLVDGYDAMGLPVAKPNLRAQLETDLKDICEGRKRPEVVLAQQVAKYREVYQTVTTEALKIDQALAVRLNETPLQATTEMANTNPSTFSTILKCPKCKADMVLRTKKDNTDLYIGCMSFPQCKNVIWLPSIVESVKVLDTTCNMCGPNYKMLEFKWKGRSIDHLYPAPYKGCIGGCDISFNEILNIHPDTVRPNARTPNSTGSNTSTDSGLGSLPSRSNITANTSRNTQPARRDANPDDFTNRDFNGTNDSVRPRNTNSNTRGGGNSNPRGGGNSNPRGGGNSNPRGGGNSNTRGGGNSNPQGGGSSNPRGGGSSNGWAMPAPNNFPDSNSSMQSGDDSVLCSCHKIAILLTVKKSNHNFGRKFYKCQQPKESGGCDFFLWAPEGPDAAGDSALPSSQNPSTSWGGANSTNNRGWGQDNQDWGSRNANSSWDASAAPSNPDVPNCDCNLPSKPVTVQKDTPNKGRSFYGCPKSQAEGRCRFFQWADEGPSTTSNWGSTSASGSTSFAPAGRGRGRGRGSRGGGGGAAGRGGGAPAEGGGARRKCSNCRQEGHFRGKCPQLQ